MTKASVLFVPGLAGSILFGKNLETGSEELVFPRLVNADATCLKYLLCDVTKDFNIVQRDKNTLVYPPDNEYGLYAISNLLGDFYGVKSFIIIYIFLFLYT